MSVSQVRFGAERGELPVDEVVVDRRAGFAVQATLLREHRPDPLLAEHNRCTRFSPATIPWSRAARRR